MKYPRLTSGPRPACRCRHARPRGFTLVELIVVLALTAVLMLTATPSIGTWIADSRVRSAADALQAALRTAQHTAITRSRGSVFVLTGNEPAWNATPKTNARRWYSRVQPLTGTAEAASADSYIEGSVIAEHLDVTLQGPALLCFNSLGQLTSRSEDDTGLAAACTAPGGAGAGSTDYTVSKHGASRELKVQVSLGGRVRLCDASKTLSSENPDGC